jgi:hypothetical protein
MPPEPGAIEEYSRASQAGEAQLVLTFDDPLGLRFGDHSRFDRLLDGPLEG